MKSTGDKNCLAHEVDNKTAVTLYYNKVFKDAWYLYSPLYVNWTNSARKLCMYTHT
jgi:hypothetical protein